MLSFNSKKHSTIESLLKDIDYCKWLMTNNWFKNKEEYKLVSEGLRLGEGGRKELLEPKKDILKNYPLDTDIIENGLYKNKQYGYIKELVYNRNIIYYDNLCRWGNKEYSFSCSSDYYKEIMKIESYIKFCSKSKSKLGKYCQYIITTKDYKDLINYSNLEYRSKFKYRFKGKFLEELAQEVFKPSRISYILSLDPDYEF